MKLFWKYHIAEFFCGLCSLVCIGLCIVVGLMTYRVNRSSEVLYGDWSWIEEAAIAEWSGDKDDFRKIDIPLSGELQRFTFYLSQAYDIDYAFVLGIMRQESNFCIDALSFSNDYGLMQINIINHPMLEEKLGITNFLDGKQNIRAGLYILRILFEKYEDPNYVLMAYNIGEGGAAELWHGGIFETPYSKSVLGYAEVYRSMLEED